MIPKECEKCIHCSVCAYNMPKEKRHCDFYEESRPKGHWIDMDSLVNKAKCSACGDVTLTDLGHPNFCPNCGADMRKERKNDTTIL